MQNFCFGLKLNIRSISFIQGKVGNEFLKLVALHILMMLHEISNVCLLENMTSKVLIFAPTPPHLA